MLYIIDGTGDFFNDSYNRTMANGFCRRLNASPYRGYYERGPELLGLSTYGKAREFRNRIVNDPGLGKQRLFLAGHSRGGAAVIKTAQLLHERRIMVDAMFLFDAVDRTMSFEDVQKVPRNVKRCYHARRKVYQPAAESYADAQRRAKSGLVRDVFLSPLGTGYVDRVRTAYDRYDKADNRNDRFQIAMRTGGKVSLEGASIDFGNAGTEMEAPCTIEETRSQYVEAFFYGSHGAIGGSPKKDEDGNDFVSFDRQAVVQVWEWMCEWFNRERLPHHDDSR